MAENTRPAGRRAHLIIWGVLLTLKYVVIRIVIAYGRSYNVFDSPLSVLLVRTSSIWSVRIIFSANIDSAPVISTKQRRYDKLEANKTTALALTSKTLT